MRLSLTTYSKLSNSINLIDWKQSFLSEKITCYPSSKSCTKKQFMKTYFHSQIFLLFQVVSIGVNERMLNATSFLIYWWIAVPQNMTFEYLPSIYSHGDWKNVTTWIEQTEYRFTNLEPFTLYNVTVYVRIKGSTKVFVPYLYYEVATAEGGKSIRRKIKFLGTSNNNLNYDFVP